ncbi:DUF998 domain-containing protein [Streptomyces sp. NPDC057424]|uniref:DUF998 domain-containing protein n=1 Tax=Streptomyces sp. NPDC057424 TaxID=3346127 RepID=UPI0036C409FC
MRIGGITGPLVFTAGSVVQNILGSDDDWLHEPVSSLCAGSLGWIQSLNFAASGSACCCSPTDGTAVRYRTRAGRVPGTALLVAVGCGLFTAAAFPLARDTTGGDLRPRPPLDRWVALLRWLHPGVPGALPAAGGGSAVEIALGVWPSSSSPSGAPWRSTCWSVRHTRRSTTTGAWFRGAIIPVLTFPCDRGLGIAGRQWGETLAAYGEHTSRPLTPVDHPVEEMLGIMSVDH